MDIRKYLKKPSSSKKKGSSSQKTTPSNSASASATRSASAARATRATRSSPRKKPSKFVDISDDDDEEDFQPKRKRSTPSKPTTKHVIDVEENQVIPPSRTTKKRSRSSAAQDADASKAEEQPKEAGNPSGGYGGGDPAIANASEPPAKKKKWVPRTDAPPNRGNKPLPVGAPDCLAGKVFVITGVLDSLLREECEDLVKEYGARVVKSVSKKVTHGVVGMEPGESKLSKLRANGTPMIDEDKLFEMISSTNKGAPKDKDVDMEKDQEEAKEEVKEEVMEVEEKPKGRKSRARTGDAAKAAPVQSSKAASSAPPVAGGTANATLWVDKYRPSSSDDLVANKKAVSDLRQWLENWKSKFLYGGAHNWKQRERGDQDWAAVLLVGAPGIGKTTAAHVICRELGFEPHEFNASDVRSKGGVQMLAETVMVANSMSKYLKITSRSESQGLGLANGKSKKKAASGPQSYPEGQVLIMDEVDGMSSGDRGGSQELIRMIKTTKVPIICIANDDSSSNMRSLANNCFKIRFRRPMVSQVSKRISEIARREGFREVQDQTLQKLAEGCNGDIRQMINLLQTWRTSSASLSFGQVKERLAVEGKTVIQKSIFELARGFFMPGADGSVNSLVNRTENFFADSDLMPLFIQENYINTIGAQNSLDSLADAAESISEGDLCNTLVRREARWELMPSAAILSAIRPGSLLGGGLATNPQFPGFLGNLSKGNKWKRIVQGLEMKVKAVQTTTGSTRAFRLDYIPAMTTCLAMPLIRGGASGIEEVVERLDSYYLEKDPDWTEILEAGVYAKGRSPLENIKSGAKTGLTRSYNSGEHRRSTVTGARVGVKQGGADVGVSRKKREEVGDVATVDDDPADKEEEEEENDGDDEDDEDVETVVAKFGKKKRGGKGGKGGKGGGKSGSKSGTKGNKGGKPSSRGSSGRGGGKRGRGRR